MAPYLDEMSSPPPAPGVGRVKTVPAATMDDLDDLYDYDAGLDEAFADIETSKKITTGDPSTNARTDDALGLDKEVEVTKKPRAPRVKLDEDRLLSQAGIPKLRRRAKDIKFKGKGHEYSDCARLLSLYQLWLDDLFPKAQFADALAMVEKLGHKKRIQMMRGEWINEDKPGYQHSSAQPEEDIFGELSLPPREQRTEAEKEKPLAPIFQRREEGRETTPGAGLFVQGDEGEEDLYNATPRVSRTQEDPPAAAAAAAGELVSIFGPPLVRALTISPEAEAEELPDDFDELDALLAEQGMDAAASAATKKSAADAPNDVSMREQDFDDEMEAMAEMGMEW